MIKKQVSSRPDRDSRLIASENASDFSAMPSIQTNLGVRSASAVVDGGNKDCQEDFEN